MLSSCDISGRRGIMAVRAVCLLVIAVGLVILMTSSSLDRRSEAELHDRRPRQRQQSGGDVMADDDDDVVKEDGDGDEEKTEDDDRQLADTEDPRHGGRRSAKLRQSAWPAASAASASSPSPWDYDWDFSAADSTADEKKLMGVRILILVRHGQYDLSTGILTDLGREQAMLTGQRLRAANISYSEIIYSTLDRATETARIIYKCLDNNGIPFRPDDILVEGGPIQPKPTVTYWQLPAKSYHLDGPRMEAAFRRYFHRGDKNQQQHTFQILVGHGNLFRFFALRALQLSSDAWMRVFIPHASISVFQIDSNGIVSMMKFGDSGHMPIDKITY